MIINIMHRPASGELCDMFHLQQKFAHDLNLKVTVMMPYDLLFDTEVVKAVKGYHLLYNDEIGVWFGEIANERINEVFRCKEPFLWLHTKENKKRIIETVIEKFREVFGEYPETVGGYHMDAYSIKLLREMYPSVKISVAGCFEEGVKVYHGCNNSWYLFNEGMPWSPWYPSKENSLRPAADKEEWSGVVAVPHLVRDMVLSYEGRNDFFASHPANIQRAMANDGGQAPYVFNLLDLYRYQERYNNGFSYTNVFVGPNWLKGSAYVQDSDEVTQGLYRRYLEYIAELRDQGSLEDMYLSEFADWFTGHVPAGTSQVYEAKEILYGSGKTYFWYSDPWQRVTIDLCQGGSIGDLRPLVSRQERWTGADRAEKAVGSNPYLIHSQYRTGNAFHYADGARTTLILTYKEKEYDLADCPARISRITRAEEKVELVLDDITVEFEDGDTAVISSSYVIEPSGRIRIRRRLRCTGDEHLRFREYFKGCYGVNEYPEDMTGIVLRAEGSQSKELIYRYEARKIETKDPIRISAEIPRLKTVVSLAAYGGGFDHGYAEEGYVFNPYYTLALEGTLEAGAEKEAETCLELTTVK